MGFAEVVKMESGNVIDLMKDVFPKNHGFYHYIREKGSYVYLEDVLEEALDSLDEEHAMVLKECYFNRSTYKSIARKMGVRGETVKAKKKKGLRDLRLYWAKELSKFKVPAPEELEEKERKIREREEIKEELHRFVEVLSDIEKEEDENGETIIAKAMKKMFPSVETDRKALKELAARYPEEKKLWKKISFAGLDRLSELKKRVENNEIMNIKGIGEKGYRKLKQILEETKEEVQDVSVESVPLDNGIMDLWEAIEQEMEKKIRETEARMRKKKKDSEALEKVLSRYKDNRISNILKRKGVKGLSHLKEMIESGRIKELRGIGSTSESFLRMVLKKERETVEELEDEMKVIEEEKVTRRMEEIEVETDQLPAKFLEEEHEKLKALLRLRGRLFIRRKMFFE